MIRGGRVVDRDGQRRADVAVEGERIAAVGDDLEVPRGARVLEAGGCVVAPGLVDLHTHLRQPGDEEAETVESGARAAALGGFTAVVAMPNTDPPLDSAEAVRTVLDLAAGATAEVAVAGAITVGRRGERLAPMAELAALGVRLFTDDGAGVQSAGVMRRALDYAKGLDVILAEHCEEASLACGGAMHEGAWSSKLGLPGVPATAEEVMVARDLALAEAAGRPRALPPPLDRAFGRAGPPGQGGRRRGDRRGRAAPLYAHRRADLRLRPGVQGEPAAAHRRRRGGGQGGSRRRHPRRDRDRSRPPPSGAQGGSLRRGVPGHARSRDRARALALGELDLPIERVLALLSWQPAALAGLDPSSGGSQGGPVAPGEAANLCVVDPAAEWTVDPAALASRSRNTPYAGMRLTGRVRHTLFRGEPVVLDARAER